MAGIQVNTGGTNGQSADVESKEDGLLVESIWRRMGARSDPRQVCRRPYVCFCEPPGGYEVPSIGLEGSEAEKYGSEGGEGRSDGSDADIQCCYLEDEDEET